MKYRLALCLQLGWAFVSAQTTPFTEWSRVDGFFGLGAKCLWSDVDNDGDDDLLVQSSSNATLYRNQGGRLVTNAGLVLEEWQNEASWVDIDRDGDQELAYGGSIYRLESDRFTKIGAPSIPSFDHSLDWADYDDNGYPDLLATGSRTDFPVKAYIYANLKGTLILKDSLPGIQYGVGKWADYDSDGDFDVLLSGPDSLYHPTLTLYERKDGAWIPHTNPFSGMTLITQAIWNDFDGDHDPDILVAGNSGSANTTQLFRNNAGIFQAVALVLPVSDGMFLEMKDYDGDSDLDILTSSRFPNCRWILENNEGTFVRATLDFSPSYGISSWGRLDKNGYLAMAVMGYEPLGVLVLKQDRVTLESRNLTTVADQASSIGDFDNDGDLDFITVDGWKSYLHRNASSSFASEPLGDGECRESGDVDRDGDLDLLCETRTLAGFVMNLRRNQGGVYEPGGIRIGDTIADTSMGAYHGKFGDYDQDGDLDILTTKGVIFRNGQGRFDSIPMPRLPGYQPITAWVDLDQDGDLDIFHSARQNEIPGRCRNCAQVFFNKQGSYEAAQAFEGFYDGEVSFGDYDSDGDLDAAVGGFRDTGWTASVFRNFNGSLVETPVLDSSRGAKGAAWGDFDSDGDLDLLLSGNAGPTRHAYYRNVGGKLFLTYLPLAAGVQSLDSWADFDRDGNLDILMCNPYGSSQVVLVHRVTVNPRPAAPLALDARIGKGAATLSWQPGSDANTPSAGLSHALRIGTSPGGMDILAPEALPDGRRLKSGIGPAQSPAGYPISGLANGSYYWSVQSVDHSFAGSQFASEGKFTLGTPDPAGLRAGVGNGQATLVWNKVESPNLRLYQVYGDTLPGPTRILDSTGTFSDTSKTVKGLINGKTYWFRVAALDVGYNPSGFSNEATCVPDGTPPARPGRLEAEAGDRAVTLRWEAGQEGDFREYRVYLQSEALEWIKVATVPGRENAAATLENLQNGRAYLFAAQACDTVGNCSGLSDPLEATPAYLVSADLARIDFGSVPLGGFRDTIVYLENRGHLNVAMGAPEFRPTVFATPTVLPNLAAHSLTPFTIRFRPPAAGGDFAGSVRIPYGSGSLEIALAGKGIGAPHARILGIIPSASDWDPDQEIQFSSVAGDSDNAGAQPDVVEYIWTSDRQGRLGSGVGYSLKASGLAIGRHAVSLRVVDNEGDTSAPAAAVFTIRSRKPYLRIDRIDPPNLILRGGGDVRFRATAYDRDEGATPEKDSLRSLTLYSTLEGPLSGAKDTTLPSTAFRLGLHGFYLMAVDNDGDTALSDTAWIPVQPGIGHAVLVAGTAFNDYPYFFMNIAPNANWAYGRLLQRGFPAEQIHYLNPVGWQGLANPYVNSFIVDETQVTLASLHQWLRKARPDVEKGVPLLLALVGHGQAAQQEGRFYLNPTEALLPDTLDAWLSEFKTDDKTPLIVLLDFCYSGSFFKKLLSGTQNRILIASSAAHKPAYFNGGRGFSNVFFNAVQKGKSVTDAFLAGKDWSDANAPTPETRAEPWVSGNADVRYNEEEGDLKPLRQVYIGGTQQFQSVETEWDKVQLEPASSERLGIRAQFKGKAPDSAWYALLALEAGDSLESAMPWQGGRLAIDSSGAYAAMATLPQGKKGEVLVTLFGQSGGEAMMPLSATVRMGGSVGLQRFLGRGRFELGSSWPNPFSVSARIPYFLCQRGRVDLTVYDLQGRPLRSLERGIREQGGHEAIWDGRTDGGRPLGHGLYWMELKAAEGIKRKLLIKN